MFNTILKYCNKNKIKQNVDFMRYKAVKQEKLAKLEAKPVVQKVTRKPAKGLAKVEAQHSKLNKRESSQRRETPSKKRKQ